MCVLPGNVLHHHYKATAKQGRCSLRIERKQIQFWVKFKTFEPQAGGGGRGGGDGGGGGGGKKC